MKYDVIVVGAGSSGCPLATRLSGRAVSNTRSKAMSLLDESLAISSELGMRPLIERVLSRREVPGGRRWIKPPSYVVDTYGKLDSQSLILSAFLTETRTDIKRWGD